VRVGEQVNEQFRQQQRSRPKMPARWSPRFFPAVLGARSARGNLAGGAPAAPSNSLAGTDHWHKGNFMKTWLCALICALGFSATASVLAQDKAAGQLTSAEWLARIQSDKKGIVTKSMDLTTAEAAKFWPLYEQFERELALPRSAANRAILDLIAADGTLTDANAKRLVEQVQGAALEEARLNQKHFKQLLKVLPALRAARYMQIESKLQAVVRYETAKAIPLVQ